MNDVISPTRTATFEARLKKRYAAERRFKAAGLGAILFSVAVLVFLLVTMTINGIGGFQRVTVKVPVDFAEVGLTIPGGIEDRGAIVRSLETQGLPDLVEFAAERELGEDAAEEVSPDAWRIVAKWLAEDPELVRGDATFALPVSDDLAAAYGNEQSPLASLAHSLADQGK